MLHDTVVEVLATQVRVTSGGQHLKDAIIDGEEGDIESATSQVIDNDLTLASLLVQAVRNGGGGGLVDDTKDVEAGNGSGILGGLTLGVVKVCWNAVQIANR